MLHNEGEHRQTIQNVLQINGTKKHYKCPKAVSHKLLSQGYLASPLSLHFVVLAMYIIGGSVCQLALHWNHFWSTLMAHAYDNILL